MLKVAFVILSNQIEPTILAAKTIHQKTGVSIDIYPRTAENLTNPESLNEFIKVAQKSHIVLMHLMGGKKGFTGFDQVTSTLRDKLVPLFASDVQSDPEIVLSSTVDKKDYQTILEYIKSGGAENYENLLRFLANHYADDDFEVNPPKKMPFEGIYHPKFGHILTLTEYIEKLYTPGKPTVGVLFHHDPLKSGETVFADSFIESIERQGANAILVFFSVNNPAAKNLIWVVENYFMKDGQPIVDVAISTLAHSLAAFLPSSEPADTLFQKLGVPVLKAIATYNTFEQWRDSPLGLDFNEVAWNVTMPEFDGMIITVPVTTKCISEDSSTGTKITSNKPIPERLDKMVRLSINWAKLRHISVKDKKVAIILHNYPPRNDNIGSAAGLDSAPSVINLLKAMSDQGYKLDYLPENGQKLMEVILNGLTNDQRWLSPEELANRAIAKIPNVQYLQWFNELPADVRQKLEGHWGKPPGKAFNYKGDLLVSGVMNGNVFIGIQPPRGYADDPESIYHDPDLPMPYHYHAYYRWIRDVFKANVIVHFGKHGTMEWLPGKSVGLSASCFPDIVISDLPNVYPYLIDNPGEGTGAKRRSYACMVDYLIPVMHNADAYEDLAKICVHLQEYYRAKLTDPGKLIILQKMIWETVVKANLHSDLAVTEDTVLSDFDAFLEKLHAYINELSDTQIRDGLHIMGEPPTGFALEEFLVALTRLSNGAVPSLRESLAELKGYDYEALLANRGALRADGRANGDVIDELNALALEIMAKFHAANFEKDSIDELLQAMLKGGSNKLRKCLTYISTFLVPALDSTTDEITHTLSACADHYVPAGPSGDPTRGMGDILPTGRNFYSIDPRCVPSVAAWKVGVDLGDALLKRYMTEEGKYPETVAIVVWATDCMRTNGDDVAEIMYLMGIKPVWEESSGRVLGVEPIPLETLRRPRIDVTIRISGLFRDNFPNIVHLLDEAVAMVAELKETSDKNYIKKHVEAEVMENVSKGMDALKAREEACYRIFGDIPGCYGSGVNEAIETKNWKTQADLANIYVSWGCYIYSRKNFGLKAPELFKQRLCKVDLTVKNMDTREYDALQIDDTYSYHAGMDVAIKEISGKAPRSFYGDSSDPDRVKVRTTAEEIKYCFRARLANPKWIEGLKRHGYHGATEFSRQMDYVIGWDATEDVIEDWMYEDLAEKFVLDQKMQEWLKDVNPYALQNMTERLLEAIERGMWEASDEMKQQLQQIYLTVEGILEGADEKK